MMRRVQAGDPIGHYFGLLGTLGLAVEDAAGRRFALTCAHVVAPHWTDPRNDSVESPPDGDGRAGDNVIGTVADWTVLEVNGVNTVDLALVACEGVLLTNAPLALDAVPRFTSLPLADFGRLAGRHVTVHSYRGAQDAVVESLQDDVFIDYSGTTFRFSNVLSYRAHVQGGDSGSAVYDPVSREVVGLHFAGRPLDDRGYAIPAPNILRAFARHDLRIVPT